MAPGHRRIVLSLGRLVTEITPALDHLLRGTTTDPELQAAAADQVGSTGILGHIEGVLIAHIDHAGADLDPIGPGTNGSQ